MNRIKIEKKQLQEGNLILVNAKHPIGERQGEKPLIQIGSEKMEPQAGKLLLHLLAKIDYKGQILAVSGYRSKREQAAIYTRSLEENGTEFTEKYVALPGCSEHQTGLAIDLGENREKIDYIRPDFPDSGICRTFREAAPEYGFVERYREGKESLTGIASEPWHFRYVGFPHSRIMAERGMVLEEYILFLKQYLFEKNPLIYETPKGRIEISCLPAVQEEDNECWIQLPEAVPYQLSGNNEDGMILTIFTEKGRG